jgi:hypothetical protein
MNKENLEETTAITSTTDNGQTRASETINSTTAVGQSHVAEREEYVILDNLFVNIVNTYIQTVGMHQFQL